jgi:hypothetical protein
VSLRLDRIIGQIELVAEAGGTVVARRPIDPAAETNDWLRSPKEPKYRIYEARGDVRFTIPLTAGTPRLAVRAAAGDWVTFRELTIRMPDGQRRTAGTDATWGRRQTSWRVASDGRILPPPGVPEDAMLAEYLQPWRDIAAQGEQVFVGEWGCYNKTPHPVALAWMKAWLEQWKSANLGWALWNFRGSFGVLDSDRADVAYEDWNGTSSTARCSHCCSSTRSERTSALNPRRPAGHYFAAAFFPRGFFACGGGASLRACSRYTAARASHRAAIPRTRSGCRSARLSDSSRSSARL